jgi:hypothetical protein
VPLGEQFLRNYPGLIPVAADLWRRWLREHEGEFLKFDYNLHVGEGVNVGNRAPTGDPAIDQKFADLHRLWTQKRIDVVGYKPGETWIIEIDERPGPRTLGQVLLYRNLLPRYVPVDGKLELALICKRMGPDMLEAFDEAGVLIWQLDPA